MNVYILSFFVALFFEYPFRTLAKIMFCPPIKTLRLKHELAEELNVDDIFTETEEDELVV